MKTKIVKSEGYYKLVVADEEINKKYDCTNENPIVLGNMINHFNSGCWTVCDYRLTKTRIPSEYLEEGFQDFGYETEAEKELVLSKIHSYYIDEENKNISWHRFDSTAYDGDNPSHIDSTGRTQSFTARFTYKGAYQRLREQKEFWEKFEGDDLKNEVTRIPNSHRQMHHSEFYKLIKELKENSSTELNNSTTIKRKM